VPLSPSLPAFTPSLTQQFDPGHFSAVADAVAQLDDPGIAARARREALAELGEQAVGHRLVLEPALDEAAGVEIAAPRQRDQPLGEGAELLGLGLGRHDAVVAEQARRHVVERRLLVARRARQLATFG